MRDRLTSTHDITLVQEGHGNNLAWERLKTDFDKTHLVAYSCTASHATGGLGLREPQLIEHVTGRAATLI